MHYDAVSIGFSNYVSDHVASPGNGDHLFPGQLLDFGQQLLATVPSFCCLEHRCWRLHVSKLTQFAATPYRVDLPAALLVCTERPNLVSIHPWDIGNDDNLVPGEQ